MLKKAWNAAFLRRYKIEYATIDPAEDKKALTRLARQAEIRGWDLHKATNFFMASLEVIARDKFWCDRVGLEAASRTINSTYVYCRKKIEEERARGDFDAEKFKRIGGEEPNVELANAEMAKIKEIIRKSKGKDQPRNWVETDA